MPAVIASPTGQELLLEQHPTYHSYSFGVIRAVLELVMDAATSLRGASATLRVLGWLLPEQTSLPVANTGQNWILRIGLYELNRPKEQADDWVWIVDHTIQIGTVKCLLVVGCRLSVWHELKRPLEHRDLEVFALEPVKQSNGEIVQEQLEQISTQTGIVPHSIVSDHGCDLKSGIDQFRQQYPETKSSYDIAHKMALLLKRNLERDSRWAEYSKECGQAKNKMRQSELAHLLPPAPKSKARYMNVESHVKWGTKTLGYFDRTVTAEQGQPIAEEVDIEQLKEKLGWLCSYRDALREWASLMAVVSSTLTYIRVQGYHASAASELTALLQPLATCETSSGLVSDVVAFVREQSTQASPQERLIGSSECLESLIGKGKRLEGQQSKSGFTKMILATAAAVVTPTIEYLEQALSQVTTKHVTEWCTKHLGVSVQARRHHALNPPVCGTKIG